MNAIVIDAGVTRHSLLWLNIIGLVIMMCVLTACVPQEQAFDSPAKAPYLNGEYYCPGGETCLYYQSWFPEKDPKAIIIALHGFNDYAQAFDQPAKYLNAEDIAVIAFDQRGFGRGEQTGIWGGVHNMISDAQAVINVLRNTHPDIPIFLLGESMGGAVAISAAAEEEAPMIDGVILVAPAVWGDDTFNGFYRAMLWTMAHTMPGKEMTGEGLKIQATDNIDVLRRMSTDIWVRKKSRVDAIYGLVALMDYAYTHLNDLDVPVLLLYGANDQVIPPGPIIAATRQVKAPLTVGYYPHGWHMLLRDIHAYRVLDDIAFWLNNPQMPLPSRFDKDWETRIMRHNQ